MAVWARFPAARTALVLTKVDELAAPELHAAVAAWVERFGRRGTEPNELFRSEFGQNSVKIQEFSVEN